MLSLPPALQPLAALEQFVPWIALPATKPDGSVIPGKFGKFPVDWRTGYIVSAVDPQHWTSAGTALAMAPGYDRGYGAGAGFVFTRNDPFYFLDIDGALQPDNTWSPLAVQLCQRLAGASVEISHSGRGLHIIGRSHPFEHSCKNVALGLELYTADRFVALTGSGAAGDAAWDSTAALGPLIAELFPPVAKGEGSDELTTEPVAGWAGPVDDDELLAKAMASRQRTAAAAFGGEDTGPTFADLWEARVEPLAAKWPSSTGKPFDGSSADMALANMLAFWTGKHGERMERLMRRSALARDKWDHHRTYLVDTIVGACRFTRNVYAPREASPNPAPPPPSQEVMEQAAASGGFTLRPQGREYMGPADQVVFFQGCVYVKGLNRVWCIPHSCLYGKAEFDVVYGGHLFVIDPTSSKTTDSAWDVFTKSRVYAPEIVSKLCFRPEHPPAARIVDGPDVLLNTYAPYYPLLIPGDPGPFLRFLAKILPSALDRKILLHWLAAMVQNPGVKFQWWPVLQGTKGNGKTLIITLMTYLMGERYTHLVNAQAAAREGLKFNSWVEGNLFLGIEEINVSGRRDFLEELKPFVTNHRLPIEGKGTNQITGDNRINGICCTNHKDGVPVSVDERRYAIFYTAQQSKADLRRDNMDGRYFPDLYDWLRGTGAYAKYGHMSGAAQVGHFLANYELEDAFNPATDCVTAPDTSSSADAIENSRGRAEQEILEAIEEGRLGFSGGWVSSTYLDALLLQLKIHVPRTKRRELMQSLGYDLHPALVSNGRTNEIVLPDNRKPILYMRNGHIAQNVQKAVEVGRLYTKAQQPQPVGGNVLDGKFPSLTTPST